MTFACFFIIALAATSHAMITLTPLDVDNHPCKPEYLKNQNRYICASNGDVTCQTGWSKENDVDPLFPCISPVCDSCVNGQCVAPNVCACEIGWEGVGCSECITLPGCVHGVCTNALECNCNGTSYLGALCDIPQCTPPCLQGNCIAPDTCNCNPGWIDSASGKCDQCVPRSGCSASGGTCTDPDSGTSVGNACFCLPDYEGPLCDQPKCDPACIAEQGVCAFGTGDFANTPFCMCNTGFTGEDCIECVPLAGCPVNGTCLGNTPNTCDCSTLMAGQTPQCGLGA